MLCGYLVEAAGVELDSQNNHRIEGITGFSSLFNMLHHDTGSFYNFNTFNFFSQYYTKLHQKIISGSASIHN